MIGYVLSAMAGDHLMICEQRPMALLARGVLTLHQRINYRGYIEQQRQQHSRLPPCPFCPMGSLNPEATMKNLPNGSVRCGLCDQIFPSDDWGGHLAQRHPWVRTYLMLKDECHSVHELEQEAWSRRN